jgi:hypothetical protein
MTELCSFWTFVYTSLSLHIKFLFCYDSCLVWYSDFHLGSIEWQFVLIFLAYCCSFFLIVFVFLSTSVSYCYFHPLRIFLYACVHWLVLLWAYIFHIEGCCLRLEYCMASDIIWILFVDVSLLWLLYIWRRFILSCPINWDDLESFLTYSQIFLCLTSGFGIWVVCHLSTVYR